MNKNLLLSEYSMFACQGWIPPSIVEEALTGFLLDYVRHLRTHIVSL